MLDFMFFLKTIVVTFLIALLLQTRVGAITIEDHAHQFIQSSSVMTPLHQVAQNGATMIKRSLKWISSQVSSQLSRHSKGSVVAADRMESFGFQRSEQYQKAKQPKEKPAENSDID